MSPADPGAAPPPARAARIVRHVIIKGRVQGVGFRYWVEQEALLRGLEGFVRNRRDGSVEAAFLGSENVVAAMLEACRRGPPGAWITAIEEGGGGADVLASRRPGERFSVLPTL
jgi:acylphosphatase